MISSICPADPASFFQLAYGPSLQQRDCEQIAANLPRHEPPAGETQQQYMSAYAGPAWLILPAVLRLGAGGLLAAAAGAAAYGLVKWAQSDEQAAADALLNPPWAGTARMSIARPDPKDVEAFDHWVNEQVRSINRAAGESLDVDHAIDWCAVDKLFVQAMDAMQHVDLDENAFRHVRLALNHVFARFIHERAPPGGVPGEGDPLHRQVAEYAAAFRHLDNAALELDRMSAAVPPLLSAWQREISALAHGASTLEVDRSYMRLLGELAQRHVQAIYPMQRRCEDGETDILKLNSLSYALNKIPLDNPHPDWADPQRVWREAKEKFLHWIESWMLI